jgi:hypothetical protein
MVVPSVAAILDFNMAAITNRAQNDVFYHIIGSTTDTNKQFKWLYLGFWVRPIKWCHRRWCHMTAILDFKMAATVNASHSASPILYAQMKAPAMKS